jgi:hypothetical protein
MSISNETFEKIRLEIQEFRKRLLAMARQDTTPTMVCCVGFQMVPRAKVKKRGL